MAWDAGGRFHPAYSLLGAGSIVLSGVAQSVLRRRMALPVVLAVLACLSITTVYWPIALPYGLAVADMVWAVQRSLQWHDVDRRERAIVAEAQGSPRNDQIGRQR